MATYIPPMCLYCKRFRNSQEFGSLKCEAYPQGIPIEIVHSEVDHRTHYKGDNGLTFDPVDKNAELPIDMIKRSFPDPEDLTI